MWDWELMNDIKPIWQRPAKEVEEDEYKAFYKSFSRVSLLHVKLNMFFHIRQVSSSLYRIFYLKLNLIMQDNEEPLGHIHFTAEGEVTFKSILFVPAAAPRGLFDEYGSKKNDFIKVICEFFSMLYR